MIDNSIQKQNTVMRESLSPRIKLAVTIRFLATGACYTDLQHLFRIHKFFLNPHAIFRPNISSSSTGCLGFAVVFNIETASSITSSAFEGTAPRFLFPNGLFVERFVFCF